MLQRFAPLAGALLVLAAPCSAAAAPAQAPTFAVRASRMDLGDGRRVEDAVLLVEDGRIRAAGRGVEIPAGTPVVEHQGFLTAGMVACGTASGLANETTDSNRSILSAAKVADAFDPWHPELREALEAGITTLLLTPGNDVLCGGASAAVKTDGGRVLSDRAHLCFSLHDAALRLDRFPTSAQSALAELDRCLSSQADPYNLVTTGRLPVFFCVDDRADVLAALDLAARHRLKGALHGAPLAGEVAAEIGKSGLGVVVGPFRGGAERRQLRAVVALAEARVPIAFALRAPELHPASLRLSAAMCMREGLDRASAWKALTADGAAVAGVGDRVGRLERGLDADFVLWSGDPLDLASRVVAVYVDGRRAHDGGAR